MIALSDEIRGHGGRTDPDASLMLSVRDGNVAAFNELTLRHRPHVMRVITYLMGHDQYAEDLAQEVFLRAFRARHGYVVSSKFTTWLFTIVNNVVSNARRSLAKRRETVVDADCDACHDPAKYIGMGTNCETPSQTVLRDEAEQIARVAVTKLSERQQTAVSLFYFQGLSYEAVAQEMGTTLEAVKSLLQRARSNLQQSLTDYMDYGRLPEQARN